MGVQGNSKVVDKNEIKERITPQSPSHDGQFEKEDLAPDGGWGWAVAAGMTVVNLVTFGQGASFGLVYGDFLDASGNGGTALTFINLMFMVSFSTSGLICNELLKRYSIRPVGIFGALIYATGNTVICFVPNVSVMVILVLVQGIGIGLMMTVCNISFNAYFVKRRTTVMGVTQVMMGLGAIIYPVLTGKMLSVFGFRGCVALLGAISFNSVISMFAMDPVEKHYKKPKNITEKTGMNEDQKIGFENGNRNLAGVPKEADPIRRHSIDVSERWEQNSTVRNLGVAEAEHEKPLLIEALKASHKSQGCTGSGYDIETGFRSRHEKGYSLDMLANKLSMSAATSMSSINGIAGFTQIAEIVVKKDADEKKKSIRSVLGDFFEISLLRDGAYVNISIGSSLTLLADVLFNGFLPMTMTSQGYAKSDIALVLTVAAVAELVGKILFAVFAMLFKTKARHNFLFSVYCLVVCRIAFLYCDTLMSILIVHGISGMVRSVFMVNQMLILAEHVRIERFPAAWGLLAVINGCTAIVICPLVGFVKDLTQSHVIAQYLLLGALMLCVIPWTIEILIYEIFPRKKTSKTVNRT